MVSMNDKVKAIDNRLINVEAELSGVKTEVSGMKTELSGVKTELSTKPDREEVRQILQEEIEKALPVDTYRLVKIK